MEEKKITVVYKQEAKNSIRDVALYLEEKGYPTTAERYSQKLYDFGDSLAIFPEKYAICRHATYARRKFRCAVFKKTYVFIYKLVKKQVIIYNVIHGKRLR